MKFIYLRRWECVGCGKVSKYQDILGGCDDCGSIQFEPVYVRKYGRTIRYYWERCLSGLKDRFAKPEGE